MHLSGGACIFHKWEVGLHHYSVVQPVTYVNIYFGALVTGFLPDLLLDFGFFMWANSLKTCLLNDLLVSLNLAC